LPGSKARLRRAPLPDAIERDRATYAEWGGGLTLEQFLERERRFRKTPWARGTITTWLLEDSSGRCLSSCETFRVESRWRGQAGISSGIASVYTEPAYRGKGYARELLVGVERETLKSDPGLHAQFLFSDIGSAYYEALGYGPRDAWDRVFEPEEGDPFEGAEPCEAIDALDGMRWPDTPYLLVPGPDWLDWQLERERVYSEALGKARPRAQGARVGDSRIVWSVNYRKQELFALILSAESASAAAVLLGSARRMARSLGLPRFRAWEEYEGFPWPNFGTRVEREGSLPMLKPHAPSLMPREWKCVSRATWI
jgi:GNAT superfamily N-acetyltransferase